MELVLNADPARATGTGPSRRLRRDGRIPAVVYGLGEKPVAVSVAWRELRQCLKTEAGVNAVLSLQVDGARSLCIVKDLQRHPVRRDVVHVDFLRVDPNAPITVEVPVVLTGEAKKVAALQGIVDQQLFKVAVLSRPDSIPNEISVDVSDLEIGVAITVADLTMPQGATAVSDPEATVAQGLATRSTIQLQSSETAEPAQSDANE